MNVFKKLQDARVKLHNTSLNKSGKNNFAKFNYFELADFIPTVIETSVDVTDNLDNLEIWLSKKQGTSIQVIYNSEIRKDPLIKPQVLKYKFKLGEQIRKQKRKLELQKEALKDLQARLKLKKIPHRIETYDISNLQGQLSVGSMVVFSDGIPEKSQYRRFKIKTLPSKPDDVGMMREVLTRRLKHEDIKFASQLPDLIVIDGGKPQVNAISKILSSMDFEIPVIGLAKREEEVFLPHVKNPVIFDPDGSSLRLLKQTRDEAHRFAVSYHKKLRLLQPKSRLDNIPGVGAKRRKALLEYFGSINKIQSASVDELCQVPGISRSVGEQIFLYFNSDSNPKG